MLDPFYCTYTCKDDRPFYVVAPCHAIHQRRVLGALGLWEEMKAAGIPEGDVLILTLTLTLTLTVIAIWIKVGRRTVELIRSQGREPSRLILKADEAEREINATAKVLKS